MTFWRALMILALAAFPPARPAAGAITKVKDVDQSSCNFCSNGSTITLTVPAAGVAANNLLVVAVVTGGDTMLSISVSDSAGNVYTADGASADFNTNWKVWVRSSRLTTALTSGQHITVLLSTPTMNGLLGGATATEFTGVAASPFDRTASNSGAGSGSGSGTSVTTGSTSTTSTAEELLFGAVASNSGAGFTPGSGYTALTIGASSGQTLYPEFRVVAATGTYAATGTLADNAAIWGAVITTYRGACGADSQNPTVTPPPNATITQTICN